MNSNPLVEISEFSVDYESKSGPIHALDSISLSIEENRLIAVVGESGSGKTTLGLAIIGLLVRPPAKYVGGKLMYKGTNLLTVDSDKFRFFRGTQIAMVFQEPMTSLNPVRRIGAQMEEAIRVREARRSSSVKSTDRRNSDARAEAISALKMVRIPDPNDVIDRYPFELSGGMRQRVMIAMALSQKPSLLIADEPTTALDVTTQAQVLRLMKELMNEVNTSILLITHDLAVASQVADRVAVMYAGEIVEEADVFDLFSNPLHPYTKGLLSCVPSGSKDEVRLKAIQGTVPDLRSKSVGCKFADRCSSAMEQCKKSRPKLESINGKHRVACHLY